jgi:NitT/TauT family transport system substrate-binding protein
MRIFQFSVLVWMALTQSAFADLPRLRAAVLQIGTVNWELRTIIDNGLDRKNGFILDVKPYADNGATRIAVEGGVADMAVADWIWLARQNAAGKDYGFIPYSRAVGGLVVPANSAAKSLADLKGGKLGIAGGPLDKSWLILQAYAKREYDVTLTQDTEQVYGAPPLVFKSGVKGDYQGVINFWHFLAKMKATGMRELISVDEAARGLGLDPDTPLLGYYFKNEFLRANPSLGQGFYNASREAKQILQSSDAEWDKLRPLMRVSSDAEFAQLKSDWIVGIPKAGQVEAASAQKLLGLMRDLGGSDLVGAATEVPPTLFIDLTK